MKHESYIKIHPVSMPSPTAVVHETPLPAVRRNGSPRKIAYGATLGGKPASNIYEGRQATTLDGKLLLWGNAALARAAMLTLMR